MTSKKKTCVITGGGGGIGRGLANHLAKMMYLEVIVLDRIIKDGIDSRVKTIECDLTNSDSKKYFENADYIFHLACIKPSERGTTEEEYKKNIKMTENVAKFNKNAKVIYASAGTIYGVCDTFPINEEKKVNCNKNDYYCRGKLESENILIEYSIENGWELAILRITNVYGIEFRRRGEILPNFFESIMNDRSLTIYGNGMQKRDRIFIDDLVNAFVLSLGYNVQGIFNIGSGKSYSTIKVAKMMGKILKKKYDIKFKNIDGIERKDNLLDISLAEKVLGFYPIVRFKKGLKIVLQNWLKQYEK